MFQFFVKTQIQNLICITELEKNQSDKQDFFDSYNRFIRTNTEFKLQCTNQYLAENLNHFYQDYHKLIQSFNLNSICTTRTNQEYKRRVLEEETQSILYWFTLPKGYVQSSLHHLQRKFH